MATSEVVSELVGLKQVHQREGVGLLGNREISSHLEEPIQELLGLLIAILVASRPIAKIH
jgi:hypothetical protein